VVGRKCVKQPNGRKRGGMKAPEDKDSSWKSMQIEGASSSKIQYLYIPKNTASYPNKTGIVHTA
jgi:hypothetical protein